MMEIVLRKFEKEDAPALQQSGFASLSVEQTENMIGEWNKGQVGGKSFEMLAVLHREVIVGTVSLYQHSDTVLSIGPEIFFDYRQKGFAKKAMGLAMEMARKKGYRIVSQQIRTNNDASIALHQALGFETNGALYTNAKGNPVSIYLKSLV